jgi:cellulose biosynthesis protein BcsQ
VPVKAFALHSLKGGVGKTTAAVNLAWLAAQEGLRTMLWDLDPQGAASMYLSVKTGVAGGAEHVLRGKDLELAVRRTPYARLDVLPADLSFRLLDVELDNVKKPRKRIARIIESLAPRYDLVVLDAPPGLGLLSEAIFQAIDLLLVPIIPSPLGIYVYERMTAYLLRESYDLRYVPAFFSMVDRRRRVHRDIVEAYAGKTASYLASTVPYSAEVEKMGLHRAPLGAFSTQTPVTSAFESLWQETRSIFETGLPLRPPVAVVTAPAEPTMGATPAPAPA